MCRAFVFVVLACLPAGPCLARTVTYYLTDPQGTVLATQDASGNTLTSTDYSPRGSVALGVAQPGPGFTGHVEDDDSGLTYMQARYYDSDTGRFLSTDPDPVSAGNTLGLNRFAYANANPYSYVDVDGRRASYGPDGFNEPIPRWTDRSDDDLGCHVCIAMSTSGAGADSNTNNASTDPKAAFVYAHLAEAEGVAKGAGTTAANVLGTSGLESSWGRSRFARDGNNFFGMHAPALYQTGFMLSTSGGTRMATFSSFSESARSFMDKNQYLHGVTDPLTFAKLLQDKGKFGIDMTTGKPVAGYAQSVAHTIMTVQAIIDSGH